MIFVFAKLFLQSKFGLAEFVCDMTNIYQGLFLGHIVDIRPLVGHEHKGQTWIRVLMHF